MKTITVRSMLILLIIVIVLSSAYLIKRQWSDNEQVTMIVINKSNYDFSEFWMAVLSGMNEAVEEYNIDVMYMNALQEDQIEEQKRVIEGAIKLKPDSIVLAASDYDEIGPYAEKILEAGIELILMDSDVRITTRDMVPFVGTNSLKAGEYLGKAADEAGDDSDRAILLAHYSGVKTSDDRESGIKEGYGPDRIKQSYSCDASAQVAYNITKKRLTEDPTITVVFATNENVTVGAAEAIDELGLENEVQLYGFDHSKKHIGYLEKGVVDYTMIQSPYQMGYLAIINALELARGNQVPAVIETDFLPINLDNMYDVGFREILFPFGNN